MRWIIISVSTCTLNNIAMEIIDREWFMWGGNSDESTAMVFKLSKDFVIWIERNVGTRLLFLMANQNTLRNPSPGIPLDWPCSTAKWTQPEEQNVERSALFTQWNWQGWEPGYNTGYESIRKRQPVIIFGQLLRSMKEMREDTMENKDNLTLNVLEWV